MEQKIEGNGVFRHFFLSFCVEIGKKSLILLYFLLFFFVCARNFVILARISRKRVHIHICSNSLTESAPRKRNPKGKDKLPLELRYKRRLHP